MIYTKIHSQVVRRNNRKKKIDIRFISVSNIVEMKTVSVICGLALCLFNVIAAQRLYDSECDGNVDIRYIGEELAKLRKLFVEEMAKLRVDISRVQQSKKKELSSVFSFLNYYH